MKVSPIPQSRQLFILSQTFGFKPDFWVALADAITVEGVILDMASHQVGPIELTSRLR